MFNINSLPDMLNILFNHGGLFVYSLIFVLMLVEGPIVNYIAALAISLGYDIDIRVIVLLAILGNQIPDLILYYLGRNLKKSSLKKFAKRFWISHKRINWLEINIKKHPIKTLLSVKAIPNLPVPGLILSGFAKISFKKFFWSTLIINLIFAAVYTSLGFYSGIVVSSSLKYFRIAEYLIPAVIILSILTYFITKFLYFWISKMFKQKNE